MIQLLYDRVKRICANTKRCLSPNYLTSLSETLARTVMTSITTLLALLALVLLEVRSLEFFHSTNFGVLVGTYSSVASADSSLSEVKRDSGGEEAHAGD